MVSKYVADTRTLWHEVFRYLRNNDGGLAGLKLWLDGAADVQLSQQMRAQVNTIQELGQAHVQYRLVAALADQLAFDAEQPADYLWRLEYGLLREAQPLVLDPAAHKWLHDAEVRIIDSSAVDEWLESLPAGTGPNALEPGRFVADQYALRQTAAAQGAVLTAEAVLSLAERCGDPVPARIGKWVGDLLDSVRTGPSLEVPKFQVTGGCWNWALTGLLQHPVIEPHAVFGWYNTPGAPEPPGLDLVPAPVRAALRVLCAEVRAVPRVRPDADLIRDTVAELATAYGMTALPAPDKNLLVVEYLTKDGVNFQHMYVQSDGVVMETFPDLKYHLQVTHMRQTQMMSPERRAKYGVVEIPVAELPVHARYLTVASLSRLRPGDPVWIARYGA